MRKYLVFGGVLGGVLAYNNHQISCSIPQHTYFDDPPIDPADKGIVYYGKEFNAKFANTEFMTFVCAQHDSRHTGLNKHVEFVESSIENINRKCDLSTVGRRTCYIRNVKIPDDTVVYAYANGDYFTTTAILSERERVIDYIDRLYTRV